MGVRTFAVDHGGAQVVWTAGAGRSPGSVWVDGLRPGATQSVTVPVPGRDGPARLSVTTLPDPGGPARARVATISDVHLGTPAFGHRGRIAERPHPDGPHPERCMGAALAEAVAWGADLVVVKGDLTDTGHPRQWRRAATLLAEVDVPVLVMPGNHDLQSGGGDEAWKRAADAGVPLVSGVEAVDLPGLRVVLGATAVSGHHRGRVRHLTDEVVDAASGAEAGASVLVLLHHHLHRTVPTSWPPGVVGPEAHRFLDALDGTGRRTIVSSGHSHRHRHRRHGGVTVTQVGSVKDFPGVWAGYTAFDGSLQQVVRRVSRPDCLTWTDHTRRAVLGTWRWWSPGMLSTRCFTV